MPKEYLNPPQLFPSLQYGFSQIVSASSGKLVFLSGQVGWNEKQELAGDGSFKAQVWQSFRNIALAMQSAGGSLHDVVSLRIYIVESASAEQHHISTALKAFFSPKKAPASTWIVVRALSEPELLIEIEAMAVIEESQS